MKTITSRDNAQYKELVKLAGSAQARRKSGRTLLDGVHLCQAYLQLRGLPEQCIVSETALHNPEVMDIVGQLDQFLVLRVVARGDGLHANPPASSKSMVWAVVSTTTPLRVACSSSTSRTGANERRCTGEAPCSRRRSMCSAVP